MGFDTCEVPIVLNNDGHGICLCNVIRILKH